MRCQRRSRRRPSRFRAVIPPLPSAHRRDDVAGDQLALAFVAGARADIDHTSKWLSGMLAS